MRGGQVMQNLAQAMPCQPFRQLFLRVRIGKEVFDALEPGLRRRPEPIQEVDLVEQHRQIGVEFRHVALFISALLRSRSRLRRLRSLCYADNRDVAPWAYRVELTV